MNKLELYQQAFRQAGLRMTEQRQTICAWLATTDQHPTPYEVFEAIAHDHPEISRATIYNTLNTLQQLGAIVEINFGANHTHYDTDPSPHINLICLRCHMVMDYHTDLHLAALQPGVPAALRARIEDETGFHALSARTDVLGICDECRRSAHEKNEVQKEIEAELSKTIGGLHGDSRQDAARKNQIKHDPNEAIAGEPTSNHGRKSIS